MVQHFHKSTKFLNSVNTINLLKKLHTQKINKSTNYYRTVLNTNTLKDLQVKNLLCVCDELNSECNKIANNKYCGS